MKIKSSKVLNNGMTGADAKQLFDKIEAFAAYSFNKSHSVEYSIISFWTAYVRVHYPAEYFAASMSIADEDKMQNLVRDARNYGIEVLPPNINLSSDKFAISDNKHILAPFSAVKGLSSKTAQAVIKLRESHRELEIVRTKRDGEPVYGYSPHSPIKGKFDSFEEFQTVAGFVGSGVSKTVVGALKAVGAFGGVDPLELPSTHVDRRKDQVGLLSGLMIDSVKSDRETNLKDSHIRTRLISISQDYKNCEDCSLAGSYHPTARAGASMKFMVVTDCPTWEEERANRMLEGDTAKFTKVAIKEAGLLPSNGYYTALVKARKNSKTLTNEQINGCKKFLDHEINLLKPGVIVALGSSAIRRFLPDVKGSTADLIGKAVYNANLDATIVCGINPAQCVFNPEKVADLIATFDKVAEIIN